MADEGAAGVRDENITGAGPGGQAAVPDTGADAAPPGDAGPATAARAASGSGPGAAPHLSVKIGIDTEELTGRTFPYQFDRSLVEDVDLIEATPGEDIN